MQNKSFKDNSLICICTWCHLCNDGKILPMNCRRRLRANFQETTQCVKINGMLSIHIIKKLKIITRGLEFILVSRISCLKKKRGSIYLVYSTRIIMSRLMFFKDKMLSMFPCMLGMWMLKAMWFTNHMHKKLRMRMKISIHTIMFKKLQSNSKFSRNTNSKVDELI
jgi:hypothetical protein